MRPTSSSNALFSSLRAASLPPFWSVSASLSSRRRLISSSASLTNRPIRAVSAARASRASVKVAIIPSHSVRSIAASCDASLSSVFSLSISSHDICNSSNCFIVTQPERVVITIAHAINAGVRFRGKIELCIMMQVLNV